MREHLLVQPDDRGWRLTGIVDFEPAMIGAAGYEFASLGVFVSGGDAVLWDALAQGYGDTMNPLEVMRYALLHRYSNLRWYLERVPPPAHVRDLQALACYWFRGREHPR